MRPRPRPGPWRDPELEAAGGKEREDLSGEGAGSRDTSMGPERPGEKGTMMRGCSPGKEEGHSGKEGLEDSLGHSPRVPPPG